MAGWVKLHRDIESWEWIDDAFIYWMFTRMILMANHEDKKWQGKTVERGSFVTSSENLALKFKCGRQKVRTALEKLKSTNEITIRTYSKFTVISMVNYEKHQSTDSENNQQDNQQITNKQPATNQQITTTKELKNSRIKELRTNTTSCDPDALAVLEMFNRVCHKTFKPTVANMKPINARLKEKFVLNEFEMVAMSKYGEWSENPSMAKYVRPATVFGGNFDGYLQAVKNPVKTREQKLADFFESEGIKPIEI